MSEKRYTAEEDPSSNWTIYDTKFKDEHGNAMPIYRIEQSTEALDFCYDLNQINEQAEQALLEHALTEAIAYCENGMAKARVQGGESMARGIFVDKIMFERALSIVRDRANAKKEAE